MLTELLRAVPADGALALTISRKGDGVAVVAMPRFSREADGKGLLPLLVSGPADEVEAALPEQVRAFSAQVSGYMSTLEDAARVLAEQSEAKRAQARGGKPDRTQGEADQQAVERLVSEADEAFTTGLGAANLATLRAALERVPFGRVEALAKEIKRVCGDDPGEAVAERLTALYRAGDGGAEERAAVGRALEKRTGQTLADLGLAPKQNSLL